MSTKLNTIFCHLMAFLHHMAAAGTKSEIFGIEKNHHASGSECSLYEDNKKKTATSSSIDVNSDFHPIYLLALAFHPLNINIFPVHSQNEFFGSVCLLYKVDPSRIFKFAHKLSETMGGLK